MPGSFKSIVDPSAFGHESVARIGVLVSNLGTPAAPDAASLRPYLREFLSDPRVIELPRWKWWPILHLFVLPTRPRKSAELYRKVWNEEGSPLLAITRRQADGIAARLGRSFGEQVRVAVGMRYGEPSIAGALEELSRAGCRRILVLPLYPQYSGATTASTFDAVFAELATWRWVPALRTIDGYHDEPGYVDALAASIRELWRRDGEPEKLLFSFHGMPVRYFRSGDPYHCFCQKTARLVAERLGIAQDRWQLSFQSLFGREEWLKPYTDATVRRLAGEGVRRLDVVCPGFSADCLETLEEIDGLNREFFTHAGGETYRFIPCLNDRPDHLDFLAGLAERHLAGWDDGLDEAERSRRAAESARRAAEMSTRTAR
jgi:ferrochelatase